MWKKCAKKRETPDYILAKLNNTTQNGSSLVEFCEKVVQLTHKLEFIYLCHEDTRDDALEMATAAGVNALRNGTEIWEVKQSMNFTFETIEEAALEAIRNGSV
uniref:(northern house mosquito) hypothetical protein n=1 Tax=Culex pipiens TaxID=7175 RepID=A0A8D8KST7_CULPI